MLPNAAGRSMMQCANSFGKVNLAEYYFQSASADKNQLEITEGCKSSLMKLTEMDIIQLSQ